MTNCERARASQLTVFCQIYGESCRLDFSTHTSFSPWIIMRANNKTQARVESIRYVLSLLPYAYNPTKGLRVAPDTDIVSRYHRGSANLD
jgi:Polyphosphate kinase 2 (PPK2)